MKGATIIEVLVVVVIAFALIGGIAISPWVAYATKGTVSFTVNDKAVVVSGDGNSTDSKYLVYTTAGVFEDEDSLWYWKFNSSDVYNQLEKGQTYTATVYGFRVPFMSWYRNIISVNAQ